MVKHPKSTAFFGNKVLETLLFFKTVSLYPMDLKFKFQMFSDHVDHNDQWNFQIFFSSFGTKKIQTYEIYFTGKFYHEIFM